MSDKKAEDIVLAFGPGGQYSLRIPITDIEATDATGRSFIEAGLALVMYAREKNSAPPFELQKLFDWALNPPEKIA